MKPDYNVIEVVCLSQAFQMSSKTGCLNNRPADTIPQILVHILIREKQEYSQYLSPQNDDRSTRLCRARRLSVGDLFPFSANGRIAVETMSLDS